MGEKMTYNQMMKMYQLSWTSIGNDDHSFPLEFTLSEFFLNSISPFVILPLLDDILHHEYHDVMGIYNGHVHDTLCDILGY